MSPKRSATRKRTAKKAPKKRTPTKAVKRGRVTNVDLLREAGILTATQRLAPKYENQLNELSRGDINALIRALPKAGRAGDVIPDIGREFIIL